MSRLNIFLAFFLLSLCSQAFGTGSSEYSGDEEELSFEVVLTREERLLEISESYWYSQVSMDWTDFASHLRNDVFYQNQAIEIISGKDALLNLLTPIGSLVFGVTSVDGINCFMSRNKPFRLDPLEFPTEQPKWATYCLVNKTLINLYTQITLEVTAGITIRFDINE